jgi:CheY-like chemotaxis protein
MRTLDSETAESVDAAARQAPERPRVLVIDDEPLLRRLLSHLLTRAGFQVTEAVGGADGIRQLREAPVDLVLTDLRMPDCSGWEVARAARQFSPSLPVVLVTGSSEAERAAPELRAMVRAIIPKPVYAETLLPMVSALMAFPCPETEDQVGVREREPRS